MKLGDYEIPHFPLDKAIADMKLIYNMYKRTEISASVIGDVFKYKTYNTGVFYRRLNSMEQYGFLEGKRTFKVTELGESVVHPDPEHPIEKSLKQSFLHIPLWSKIYVEHHKDPPPVGGFWSVIRKYTSIDPDEAKKVEKKVRVRYMGDVSNISDEALVESSPNITDDNGNGESSDDNGNQKPKIPPHTPEDRDMNEFTKIDLSTSIIYLQKGNEKEEYKRLRRMFDADYNIDDSTAKSQESTK
jgi:hypothetical protein